MIISNYAPKQPHFWMDTKNVLAHNRKEMSNEALQKKIIKLKGGSSSIGIWPSANPER
jgi:hypothetical protein